MWVDYDREIEFIDSMIRDFAKAALAATDAWVQSFANLPAVGIEESISAHAKSFWSGEIDRQDQ
jgi:hypothetical protein